MQYEAELDPTIETRIAQYEMAYRMQTSVPEVTDIGGEPQHVLDLYGPDALKPGTFAANCLLARRLAERGVRFIQLYHPGWDHHGGLPQNLPRLCKEVDQGCAALVRDLKQRGMLDETLVIWGGEFGRTPTAEGTDGREHHPFGFTMWLAGGGVRGGMTYGATDEFGWHAVENKVHVHDLHATVLHLMGIDHEKLTYRYGGRDYRLTDVHGRVVRDILA
jgi:arylsulfatase A-like enzyme